MFWYKIYLKRACERPANVAAHFIHVDRASARRKVFFILSFTNSKPFYRESGNKVSAKPGHRIHSKHHVRRSVVKSEMSSWRTLSNDSPKVHTYTFLFSIHHLNLRFPVPSNRTK